MVDWVDTGGRVTLDSFSLRLRLGYGQFLCRCPSTPQLKQPLGLLLLCPVVGVAPSNPGLWLLAASSLVDVGAGDDGVGTVIRST